MADVRVEVVAERAGEGRVRGDDAADRPDPAFVEDNRSSGVPWHTELAVAVKVVCKVSAVTAVSVATPARSVAPGPNPSRPQPARIAVSPTRASRLSRSGIGVRPMSAGMRITPTSKAVALLSRHDGCGANDSAGCCGPRRSNRARCTRHSPGSSAPAAASWATPGTPPARRTQQQRRADPAGTAIRMANA